MLSARPSESAANRRLHNRDCPATIPTRFRGHWYESDIKMRQVLFRLLLMLLVITGSTRAAEPPLVVTGDEQKQIDLSLPDGGLPALPGVANIQVFRASRAAPELTDGRGWTYHHHVDLAC